MNTKDLAKNIATKLNIPLWEATSRVEFAAEELNVKVWNVSDDEATEIERCIAADIRRGK